MPPSNQDPVDDIWRAIIRKAPIIGVATVVGLIIGCISVFFFAESRYRILALPWITIPGCMVIGFIIGIVLDTIVNTIRGDKPKRKKKRPRDQD